MATLPLPSSTSTPSKAPWPSMKWEFNGSFPTTKMAFPPSEFPPRTHTNRPSLSWLATRHSSASSSSQHLPPHPTRLYSDTSSPPGTTGGLHPVHLLSRSSVTPALWGSLSGVLRGHPNRTTGLCFSIKPGQTDRAPRDLPCCCLSPWFSHTHVSVCPECPAFILTLGDERLNLISSCVMH